MRTKKATINISISIAAFIIGFLPMIIVRKVFLEELGPELLGLSSLYTNIISYLSIVELGIGTAIIFSLHKPFSERNIEKIKAYLNYYKKIYRFIGMIILLLGIVLLPFIGIFISGDINLDEARLYFILFLFNTVFSYYFSYKFCILVVAQEGYKVSIATTISKLIISILQIICLNNVPSFYIYILIQIIVNLAYYIFLSRYIDSKYSWLKSGSNHLLGNNEKKNLGKNIKALMYHKIGGVIVFGTDNLIISTFINLTAVARYNNYSLLIGAVQGIISTGLNALTASIGNLLVEKDKAAAYLVHKRLFFISFWIVSMVVIILYNTLTRFVTIWLGEDQTIGDLTLFIIILNLYFQLMRGSVEKFNEGAGVYYQDRYAPLFESVINLIASIMLVKILGLAGVFIGTLISNFLVVFWVKPKMTYKYVFEEKLIKYFQLYFKYFVIGMLPFIICYFISKHLFIENTITAFLLNLIMNVIVTNTIYLVLFRKNKEFIYFKGLLLKAAKIRR
ncbi:O-unit flippase [Priestia aryabhattai]|nr:O-unit flippase [Priestia aryabhattai]